MRVITVHKIRPAVFPFLGWQFFWLAVVLCLYWPGIVILPKNDHPVFMLGRQLAANDWEWFWSLLSYNRTRILLSGDYFAFRPLMIAIIGLEDICFRNQFVLQGIICCTLFSFTATAFFMLLKRLAGILPALAVTCLWVAQAAGAEIVLWQHINPYVLAPAFLCLAAYGLDTGDLSRKRAWATGACILLACLIHEMAVMIAGGMALLALCLGGVRNPFARRVTTIYLLAALVAIALNVTDYLFIHPPPALVGPADSFKAGSPALLFDNLFQLSAAIGMANFLPDAVHLELRGDFFQIWKFWSESAVALWTGAILASVVTCAALFKSIRHSRRSGFNYDCYLVSLLRVAAGGRPQRGAVPHGFTRHRLHGGGRLLFFPDLPGSLRDPGALHRPTAIEALGPGCLRSHTAPGGLAGRPVAGPATPFGARKKSLGRRDNGDPFHLAQKPLALFRRYGPVRHVHVRSQPDATLP